MAKKKQAPLSNGSEQGADHLAAHFESHTNGQVNGHLGQHLNGHMNGHLGGLANVGVKEGSSAADKTDTSRWRLLDERGRQTWHYLETQDEVKSWPQSHADRYFLNLPMVCRG